MPRVIDKKQLNRFRNVSIPSNKDLFFRVGKRPQPTMVDGQVANFDSTTINQIDYAMETLLNPKQMPLDSETPK